MTKRDEAPDFTEFLVDSSGTLTMAFVKEPEIRSEFYASLSESWSESPAHLAQAMGECSPLAWAVHSIYSDIRDEIQAALDAINENPGVFNAKTGAFNARFQSMPEKPEQGVVDWLLLLSAHEFEERIVPAVKIWLSSPPNWNSEDDYLPRSETAQGAALEFFQHMDGDAIETLGVTIVEGEHPGSTYYAAELKYDIDTANKAATAAGIPVRFKRRKL